MANTPADLPLGAADAAVLRENTRQRSVPPLLAGSGKRLGLTVRGSGTTIPLYGYNSVKFEQAGRACGWRFPDGAAPK